MSLIHHITEKSHIVEVLVQNCVFISNNSILSKIKTQTSLNLYKSCIIPALIYEFETWISTTEDISKLINTIISHQKSSWNSSINTTCNYIHGSRRITNHPRMWKTSIDIPVDSSHFWKPTKWHTRHSTKSIQI